MPSSRDPQLEIALAKSALLKSKVLAIFFAIIWSAQLSILIVFSFIYKTWFSQVTAETLIPIVSLFGLTFFAELYSFYYFKRIVREGKAYSIKKAYPVVFLEVTFPSLVMFFLLIHFPEGIPFTKLDLMNGPPVFLYLFFIILSALYLDFKISVFIGIIAGIEYALLLIFLGQDIMAETFPPLLFFKSIIFVVSSVISGLVSMKIREAVLTAMKIKNDMIQTLDDRVKEKTKEILLKKEEIEEKNKNITDSIEYASRIQQAILPDAERIKQFIPQSFILYEPKDVVSGDFYWFKELPEKGKGCFIIAVGDCTGHGVPGALMAMIGNSLLHQIINEKKETSPARILNLMHEGIRDILRQSEEDTSTRDGMDMVLCFVNLEEKKVVYAGANRPLFYYSQNSIHEITPDKSPIGGFQWEEKRNFNESVIFLNSGDTIYLTTDGYQDQFGGTLNKKFVKKNFIGLLNGVQNLSMENQQETLLRNYEEWKGVREQTDDVLVVGVRV